MICINNRDKPRIDQRPGLSMKPLDFKKIKAELREKYGKNITDTDVASYCMYPKVFEEFQSFVEKYGDLSVVPTRYFLGKPKLNEEIHINIEQGKTLSVKLLAVGQLDLNKGTRECFFELNGEVRAVLIEDREAAIEHVSREKASSEPGSVGSPMAGVVVDVRVKEGQEVKAGDPLCVLSAMKMESVVSSPVSGKVKRVLVRENDSIAQGDLTVEITH